MHVLPEIERKKEHKITKNVHQDKHKKHLNKIRKYIYKLNTR